MSGYAGAVLDVDDPRGRPLSAPIILEIQVMTRDLDLELRAVTLCIHRKFGGALPILQTHVAAHGLDELITKLNDVGGKILRFPVDILLFNTCLKRHRIERKL
jgi:hypothetical protein